MIYLKKMPLFMMMNLRPLYEKIKKHNYLNTYITPAVYDKKNFTMPVFQKRNLKKLRPRQAI